MCLEIILVLFYSLLGTSSIIGSAIKKREVTHAKVSTTGYMLTCTIPTHAFCLSGFPWSGPPNSCSGTVRPTSGSAVDRGGRDVATWSWKQELVLCCVPADCGQ